MSSLWDAQEASEEVTFVQGFEITPSYIQGPCLILCTLCKCISYRE
jgi:hypothetical protein